MKRSRAAAMTIFPQSRDVFCHLCKGRIWPRGSPICSRRARLRCRTKLRVTGADRVRFLNGQTTNDVRKAGAEATQESCVLNAKGHLDAHLFLSATPNDIWIDADQELRELLQTRLERYVIADDVK